ncbi:MAG: extracellular solute-binding protein [Clostridia bacterium]|nr:extracellular solute-binding protein [Clostridia bacterium]
MAKRILALLMVMLMLVGMMACNKEEEETPTGSESDVAGEAQTGDPSQDPYLLTLDSSLNFNGEEITILQRKAKQDEMYAEELVGDIISDAIYTRNKAVEGKLGVRFKFQTADGTNTTYEAANGMAADLMNSLQAGIDGGYDLVSNYTAKAVALITKGAYLDFKDIPHVDMTRGWWDQDFITTSTYKDKVYSLVGAANITTTEGMYVMFVNFDLAEDTLGEQDFYQQVFDGEWTYEEMMQCLSSMGDGSSTGVYAMGLGNSSASVDGFLQSLNVKIVEKTPQGVPTVVMQDELNSTILDSLKELYHRNKSVIYDGTSSFGGQKAFQEGRAMFYVERMSFAKTYLQDATFKYGILALPKWDEDSDYRVATHNEHSCFNVM